MTRNDSYNFLATDSMAYWPRSTTAVGETLTGTIAREPKETQQTEPTGELKTWKNGDPMMQLIVDLQTTLHEDDEDDGQRRLYVKGNLRTALINAVRQAGTQGIDVGGQLAVTFSGYGEKKPGLSPPREFTIVYTPPKADGSAFLNGGGADMPSTLPKGITPEAWKALSPEAQAALKLVT